MLRASSPENRKKEDKTFKVSLQEQEHYNMEELGSYIFDKFLWLCNVFNSQQIYTVPELCKGQQCNSALNCFYPSICDLLKE